MSLPVFDPRFSFDGPEIMSAQEENWYADSPIGRIVLRYDEAAALLSDPRFRLGDASYMALHGIEDGPLFDWWMNTLMSVEPPSHSRLRGLLAKAFTTNAVERLRGFARATAERLVAELIPEADHDLVRDYADPLPARVMCELVGVPLDDYEQFHGWASDIGLAFAVDGISPPIRQRVETSIEQMSKYIAALVERRRHDPGDDLLSGMLADAADHRLTVKEVNNLTLLLVWAGQDTTSRQLGRAITAFAEHPDQWARLRAEPDLVGRAVDEVLRWTPQSRLIQRIATQNLTFRGLDVPAGSVVFCCVAAANRDPRAFPDPMVFDVARPSPSRQLAFGGGATHCLGYGLARVELFEGLRALVNRFDPPQLTGPVVWRPTMAMINGPDRLPVRFHLPKAG